MCLFTISPLIGQADFHFVLDKGLTNGLNKKFLTLVKKKYVNYIECALYSTSNLVQYNDFLKTVLIIFYEINAT